ncbi:MAG TPA: hypothetical protein VGO92_06350 [Acidimicrobiales bacterium]|nr:hypothetical protein [Acidimicrobiales bacterium]
MSPKHLGAGALALSTLVLAACGSGENRPGVGASSSASHAGESTTTTVFAASAADVKLDLTAREYAWGGMPPTVTGGKAFFTVKNDGKDEHEFELLGPDGEPAVETHVKPGKAVSAAVALTPGKWTLTCMIKEGKKTHADLGMQTEFTVS